MTSNLLSLLEQAGQLAPEMVRQIKSEMEEGQISVPSFLIEQQLITSPQLAAFLSERFAEPVRLISEFDYTPVANNIDKRELILSSQMLPVALENNLLTLATSDLTDIEAQEEFRFLTGLNVKSILVEHVPLTSAIRKLYGVQVTRSQTGGSKGSVSDDELNSLIDADDEINPEDLSGDDNPISRLVNGILFDAVRKNASDIHFEPFETRYQIRLRIDGILQVHREPPVGLTRRISTYIKILAKLNIADRRLPQDGRMKLNLGDGRAIDMRVSTLPTLYGEKVVLRLLDSGNVALDIDQLGYTEQQKQDYLNALDKPQGMILMTGPTGSGKTVSLYTGLKYLNTHVRNISTAEDPVEINLAGINQVNINNDISLDFATALRAFLRQDPDVVMVGEIRDLETAEIGIKAAQTGHLLLSTLHTNSAAETITRLSNMGVAPYNLAASLSLIIAQRLARRLCHHCKKPHPVDDKQLQSLHRHYPKIKPTQIFTFHPEGCDHCNNGYVGRVGIYEVMKIDRDLSEAIANGATAMRIENIAIQNGMSTLQMSGIEKLNQGITSLAELQRVISL